MAILALALAFMIAFTVGAFYVLFWQSNDISVSIVSETDEGNNEVTISVLNTAGATLLFYENAEMTGKIEYLSDEGWVEFCDVSYTATNTEAISTLYGGTFAELEPGEDWDVTVPEDKIAEMQNGTYRIKMTYITEKEYNLYLDEAFENRNNESEESEIENEVELPDKSPISGMIPVTENPDEETEEQEILEEEDFLAESRCEVFVKTFEYTAPEDFVGEISIDDSDIESKHESKDTKARINYSY